MTNPTDPDGADVVQRTLAPADGSGTRTLAVERTYPTDATDLWEAVSTGERLSRWMGPVTGDLRLGGRYQVEHNAGGTIEACDPPSSYAVTWEIGGEVSHVRVVVSPAEDGAVLRIEHEAPENDHWAEYGPAATGLGWEGALRGLAEHLETRAPVDAEAALAWATSTAGVAAQRTWGEQWAEATVVAGDDPDWARDAARRTVAFYTGHGN